MGLIEQVADISLASLGAYDAVIDVRSPAEFAEDHLPDAINLPVLSNAERAEIGTIYVQQSKFLARRLGAAYVAANIAAHLRGPLADRPPDFQPLLYCWRGGMRSGAMATVFAQIGWRTRLLEGGYKTWRRKVAYELRQSDAPLKIVLIDGQTGTAKSDILRRAGELGAQIIDLEQHAAHRGSAFGAITGRASPRQKMFESMLWRDLEGFDLKRPILVEAESKRIGPCEAPRRLWASMVPAPYVVIAAGLEERARYLVRAYGDIIETPGAVAAAIDKLRPFHPKARIEEWLAMAEAGDNKPLAAELMRDHYDALYDRSRQRRKGAPIAELQLDRLDEAEIDRAARAVIDAAERAFTPA